MVEDKLIQKVFTNGQCHSLAFALYDLIGGDIIVATKMSEGEVYPTHLAVLYNNKVIDIEGSHSVDGFLERWGSGFQKITKQEFKDEWEEGFPALMENNPFCMSIANELKEEYI